MIPDELDNDAIYAASAWKKKSGSPLIQVEVKSPKKPRR
jgi:hypothetical protein